MHKQLHTKKKKKSDNLEKQKNKKTPEQLIPKNTEVIKIDLRTLNQRNGKSS